ncbi:hypothetical protein CS542_00785 [Pedobacter sp. IW39]|nr:hypothetical protein CS542_00785 [Pedobacter sp. IW39]
MITLLQVATDTVHHFRYRQRRKPGCSCAPQELHFFDLLMKVAGLCSTCIPCFFWFGNLRRTLSDYQKIF